MLGVVFVFFGSNVFFHFLKMPPMSGPAGNFMGAIAQTGYMNVIGFCQVAGGLLLLVGRYAPLGLTLLGPVIVNILCYHIFMDPKGLPIAVVVAALSLFLVWSYRANFAGLVKPV